MLEWQPGGEVQQSNESGYSALWKVKASYMVSWVIRMEVTGKSVEISGIVWKEK